MTAERYEPIAMKLSEVAERLDMGKTTVGRLIAPGPNGEPPKLRAFRSGDGGTWRVLRSDFDAYIEERLAAARAEYEQARQAS